MSLEPELQVKPKFNQVTNLNPEQQSSDTLPHSVPTPSFSPSSRLPNPRTTFTQPQVPSPPHPTPSHQRSPTPYLQLILIFPLPLQPQGLSPHHCSPSGSNLMPPTSPQSAPNPITPKPSPKIPPEYHPALKCQVPPKSYHPTTLGKKNQREMWM